MVKIKIGDIFEISTARGSGYLHYVYKDDESLELVRVLPGLFQVTPGKLEDIAKMKEKFYLHFSVGAAYHRKIIRKVGFWSAEDYSLPRFMRTKWQLPDESYVWHIVDTQSWEREVVKNLTEDQLALSPWGIWNDTLLIERLEECWELKDWK